MTAYLRGVAVVTLLVLLAHYLVVATVRSPLPAEYWLREFAIVKRHQAEVALSPKLILVGGSCTLFGIDAAAVQDALHLPTINFGLHAGMRLEDHLDNARAVAKPGDTVLLSLEPAYYDFYSFTWSTWQLRNAIAWNRESLNRLPLLERLRVYFTASDEDLSQDLLVSLIQAKLHSAAIAPRLATLVPEHEVLARFHREMGTSAGFAFSVSDLDANGDLLHATDTQHVFQGVPYSVTRPASVSAYAKTLLTPFLQEMKERHVRVLFDYTPYVVDAPPSEDWQSADAAFRTQLADLGGELIEQRDAFFYPGTDFFNSALHLNERGRQLRTQALIEALRRQSITTPNASGGASR